MSMRIKKVLKNQNGSALPFVMIIGVIILIMAVSLTAVANSDFTFTQQTLESRQAYIDDKSVIEYGKVFINNDMSDLNSYYLEKIDKQNQLNALDSSAPGNASLIASLQNRIAQLQTLISQKENEYPKQIFGTKNSVTENIDDMTSLISKNNGIALTSEETNRGLKLMGVCELTAAGEDTSRVYTFDIDVQGFRRDLNYKVSIPVQANSGTGGTGIPVEDTGARKTSIHVTGKAVKINIQGEGNEKTDSGGVLDYENFGLSLNIGKNTDKNDNYRFDWLDGKKLFLKAKNIYVTAPFPTTGVWQAEFNLGDRNKTDTIWIKQDYVQNNGSGTTNTLKAKTIIFDKNLTINDNTNLNIECDTLWVKGDILINAVGGTNSTLNINAKNIIVGDYNSNLNGNIKIGDCSKIVWNCSESIFVRGNIDFLSNTSSAENIVKAKSVIIGRSTNNTSVVKVQNNTKITWDCNYFWLYGDMTTITSSSIQEFKNIVYFKSGKINLSDRCDLSIIGLEGSKNQIFVNGIIPLESNAYKVKIKNFQLFQCNGDFGLNQGSSLELESEYIEIKNNLTLSEQLGSPLTIKTNYLDVYGKTVIKKAALSIWGNGSLNVRFKNGYDQMNSNVNIDGADQVIFGGTVSFTHDNRWDTSVTAKKIYFDSSGPIKFQDGGSFKYTGINNAPIKIYIGSDIQKWSWAELKGNLLSTGNYEATVITDVIPDNLSKLGSYTGPGWAPLSVVLLNPNEPKVSDVWLPSTPIPTDPAALNKRGTEIYY